MLAFRSVNVSTGLYFSRLLLTSEFRFLSIDLFLRIIQKLKSFDQKCTFYI